MDRTYNPSILVRIDPRDRVWARNWVRFLLRDIRHPDQPDEAGWSDFSKSDVEIDAALLADAVGLGVSRCATTRTYYRPHVTAARLYLGDPNLWKTRAVDGTSETRRDAEQITVAWLAQGAAIDALIPPELLPGTATAQRRKHFNGIPLDGPRGL